MAIVKMKRLNLAVVRSQKKDLLKELTMHGCVQFSELGDEIRGTEMEKLVKSETSQLMTLRQDYQSLVHAVQLLDRYAPEKSPLLAAKPEIEREEFLDEKGLEGSLQFARKIESNDDRIKRIAGEISRAKALIESLGPWTDLALPLSCSGTEKSSLIMGTVPARVDLSELSEAVTGVTEEAELFRIGSDKAQHYVLLVCWKEALQSIQEVLRTFGFTASTLTEIDSTARTAILDSETEIKELEKEREDCENSITSEAVRRDEIKLAADKMSAKIAMAEAEERLVGTESTVIMQGWVPAENEKDLEDVFSKYDCAWSTEDPAEEEYGDVPVKLKNNKLTNGLNMVTNMYSLPRYGTVDPNPLMAPFFILFYGLMMADMGYGILMVIAAVVALKKIEPRGGTKVFMQLLFWGGISTFIMGALTGSFFSDIPYQLVHLFNPSSTWPGLPKLFSPTEDSIIVLIGALVLGVLHLNTGMVISFVQKVKNGNLADAIWEEGSLWVLLIGGILFYFKIGTVSGIPVPLIIGIAMLLFGAGRNAKGFGKVTAAFGAIYNTATGWFGDILSYSRIMALMLAGGVVGQVFNTVAIMPMQSGGVNVISVIAFILIFVLGHTMNFGLNLLGCYVHDLRLQCLEFFGKFYQDGGKPFKPLDINSKYVNAKENT